MVRSEYFGLVIVLLETEGCIHHQSLCTACNTIRDSEESIRTRMREEVAKYTLGHIAGAGAAVLIGENQECGRLRRCPGGY